MSGNYSVFVGTVGRGLWRGDDGGKKWTRMGWSPEQQVFPLESQVRAVVADPRNSSIIFAGDEQGLFRSNNGGDTWEKVPGPMDGMSVWSLAYDMEDPDTMFMGTRLPAVFRSRDAGRTWTKVCGADVIEQTSMIGPNRVLAVRIDPLDHRKIWAGVEHGGVYQSLDGGDTWARVRNGLDDSVSRSDIHDITIIPGMNLQKQGTRFKISPAGRGGTVLVTGPGEVTASDDVGESWESFILGAKDMPKGMSYMHSIAVKPGDPNTFFLCIGDTAIGDRGAIMRTKDGGANWEKCKLPDQPNSPFFSIKTDGSNPNRIWAASLFGELYHTEDGGDSWTKVEREFSEIRCVTLVSH